MAQAILMKLSERCWHAKAPPLTSFQPSRSWPSGPPVLLLVIGPPEALSVSTEVGFWRNGVSFDKQKMTFGSRPNCPDLWGPKAGDLREILRSTAFGSRMNPGYCPSSWRKIATFALWQGQYWWVKATGKFSDPSDLWGQGHGSNLKFLGFCSTRMNPKVVCYKFFWKWLHTLRALRRHHGNIPV